MAWRTLIAQHSKDDHLRQYLESSKLPSESSYGRIHIVVLIDALKSLCHGSRAS